MSGGIAERNYFPCYKFFLKTIFQRKQKLIRFLYLDIQLDKRKTKL